MRPKVSLWGWLSRKGRLRNRWARALADPDPARSLDRLRQIQRRLQENPAKFAHLWLPFLDTLCDESRVHALTDADLTALEKMGSALRGGRRDQIRPEDIWWRVLKARDTRGEKRQAVALLTRIYEVPSTSREVKTKCARDLARRSARGDEQLHVYVDYLRQVPDPSNETVVLDLLTKICTVDFEADKVRLKRAGEVARHLAENDIPVPGVQSALGLYFLRIEEKSSEAAEYFEAAARANDRDETAQVGLLAAWIQDGKYDKVARTAQRLGRSATPIVSGLVSLSAALCWLDSREKVSPSPSNVKSLTNLDLSKYVGDAADAAIGRLYLLEGNAQKAAEILQPLADRAPEQSRWNYYAAWAAVLTGDWDGVARRFAALEKWPARWIVACLLVDANPTLSLGQVPKAYAGIARLRLALARSTQPTKVNWKPGSGTLEEDLEALRTVLGYAVFAGDTAAMKRMMAMPLFHRLPLADQVMWCGLQSLCMGDQTQGRAQLEEAAVKFGYQRAALILSVHLLEQNRVGPAKQYLAQAAAGRMDTKIELFRAYIEAYEGRTDSATKRLEKLTSQGESRAHYALGHLYWHCAGQARSIGKLDHARLYREQAAGAFRTPLKAGKRSLPSDCEVLARCAEFVAHPERAKEPWSKMWDAVKQLDASHRRPWIVWNAVLAQLWSDAPSKAAAVCEEALALLQSVEYLEDAAVIAIAQVVTRALHQSRER